MRYSAPIPKATKKLETSSLSDGAKPGFVYQVDTAKLEGIKHWISQFTRDKTPLRQALDFFQNELKTGALTPEEFDCAEMLLRRAYHAAESEKQQREHIKKLIQQAGERGHKVGWVYHEFLKRYPQPSLDILRYLANKLGYSKAWASYQLMKLRGLHPND